MNRLVLTFFSVVGVQGASIKTNFPEGKIVGGQLTPIDLVPWQVALEVEGSLQCGGSIISENYILTAAHCTRFLTPETLKIRSGTNYLQNGGTVSNTSKIVFHPDYDSIYRDRDISIVRLSKPLEIGSTQQPIGLRKKEAVANETAQISGWGTKAPGDSLPDDLYSAEISIVSRRECNNVYDQGISKNMICAGEAGKDSCQGDSGGALTIDNAQVGIVSWGYGCARVGFPGVYSNVANLAEYINEHSENEARWV